MTVKRRNGRWTIDVCLPSGERIRRVSPVQTKAGAVEFEAQVRAGLEARAAEAAVKAGVRVPSPAPTPGSTASLVPTLATFAREWLNTYVVVNNKPSEVVNKESALRVHLVPFFGNYRLDQIDGRMIERYKAAKLRGVGCRKPLKPKTVNNHLIILRKLLATAEEWGIIGKVIKVRRLKTEEHPFDWLRPDESKRFMRAVELHYPQWRALFWTALHTGMRRGEIFALQWDDIDLPARQLRVRHSVFRGRLVTPKSGKGRYLPLTRRLTMALGDQKRRTRSRYCFPDVDGNLARHQDHIDRPLFGALRKAGLRRIRFHDLRHTFASQLVSKGRSLKEVQELLGHASMQMTMRYAHLSPERMREAIDVLDEDD